MYSLKNGEKLAIRGATSYISRVILVYSLLLQTSFASLENNPVPGGVVLVDIGPATETQPRVQFGLNSVSILSRDNRAVALVGVSQSTVPGKYMLKISDENDESRIRYFRVEPLPANVEQNTVVLPEDLEDLDFSGMGKDQLSKISNNEFVLEADLGFEFILSPLVSSGSYLPYGMIVTSKPDPGTILTHSWITYLTDPGSLIHAPGKSVVEQIFLSDESGLTIVLNHGHNFRSVISNIDETVLKTGDVLISGDLIGTAGPSNISDKAKVEWRVLINGSLVDPLQFTSSGL